MKIVITESQLRVIITEQELKRIISEQPDSRFAPRGMSSKENMDALSGASRTEREDTPVVEHPAPWGGDFQIPADSTNIVLWTDNDDRLKWYGARKSENGQLILGNRGLIAPSEEYMRRILPTGSLKNFVTKVDNKRWYTIITNDGKGWVVKRNYFSVDPNDPNKNIAYNPEKYIHVNVSTLIKTWFEEHWVEIAIILAASLVGIIGGAVFAATYGAEVAGAELFNILGWRMTNQAFAAYLAEAHVWVGSAIVNFDKGENGSGALDLFFGVVLPALHGVGLSKWGIEVSEEVVVSTSSKVVGKTPKELQEMIMKSEAEGGLTAAEKKLVQDASKLDKETFGKMTNELMNKANANLKGKEIKVASNKVLSKVETLIKNSKGAQMFRKSTVGAYLKKKWYRWIPTVLAHDMIFIHIVDNVAKRFGLINESIIKELTVGYSKLKTPEEKNKFMDKASEVLKTTNNIQEFETKLKNGELNVTKLDTSGVVRDKGTGSIKPKPGYDSPNFYDSLDKVRH